ncbi:LLM class flavin-dependent oxidoreductase [Nocardia sp. NBC_01377]|uniref:LLM class flavin-dependent oxidoreductase n=1 Tax=Nocardia sp. NBC_01377 TaxID=2903595 RepID=UPI00324712CF
MRIAIHSATTNVGSVEAVVAEVRRAADAGIDGYWAPMLGGQDTLTALAIAGQAVGGIELGTAVVPMPLRSPFALAQQIRTVQEAVGGRFVLGLGTSHESITRDLFGEIWRPPLKTARTYLEQLRAILSGAEARRSAGSVTQPTEILLGAVNPAMIGLATELADGLVTWSVAEATIGGLVRGAIRAAGREGAFRVVAALPVTVTDDPDGAREVIQARLGGNDKHPSYSRVLDREGVRGVAELSVVGSAARVRDRLAGFAELGVTDFAAHIVGADETDRRQTWELLAELSDEYRFDKSQ